MRRARAPLALAAAAPFAPLALALALAAPTAIAAGPKAPPPPAPEHVAVARVDVLFRRQAALVTTDLTFTRGAYRGGELAAFAAYGSPGLPRAFEARLLPVERGRFSPPLDADGGEALAAAHATHAPDHAVFSLGGPNRAGQALRLPAAALARALEPSGLAALRVRAVHLLREGGAPASLVVRLAAPAGAAPYPLGEVSLRGEGVSLRAASASLCRPSGPDLALALAGAPPPPGAVAPPRAPRSAGDALCVSAELAPPP